MIVATKTGLVEKNISEHHLLWSSNKKHVIAIEQCNYNSSGKVSFFPVTIFGILEDSHTVAIFRIIKWK